MASGCRIAITMCVCLLIGGAASGQARNDAPVAAAACDITQDRSSPSTTPATIEFVNQTGGTVYVYWVAFDGSRRLWFGLAAGGSQVQGTFIGHAWLVTDGAGNCIGFVVSDQAQKRYVIGSSAPAQTGNASSFTDPAGDSGRGADITTVVVSNDAAGQISMRIDFARLRFDDTFFLCLDTDRNSGTGLQDVRFCPRGAEYALYAHWYGAWEVSYFSRFTGPAFGNSVAPPRATLSISGGATAVTVSINRSELGGTSGFYFQLSTEPVPGDTAPDAGTWSYTLQTPKPPAQVTISALKVRARPIAPIPGSAFTVLVPSIVLSTGESVAPATVKCRAKLAGTPLNGSGKGRCTFHIPKTAGGKKLLVTVTAAYKGKTKTKAISYTVRRR